MNDLRIRFENMPGIGIVSVYCNYKEQLGQTPVNILAGLWFQLLERNEPLSEEVKNLYRKHMDRNTLPTLTDVEKVLSTEIGRYQKVFVVVDALDECLAQSRIDFLTSLRALQPQVNLLVTSRFNDSIAHAFENCPRAKIEASIEDVLTYVSSRISGQLAKHIKRDPSLAKEIENTVVEKAQNMYGSSYFVFQKLTSVPGSYLFNSNWILFKKKQAQRPFERRSLRYQRILIGCTTKPFSESIIRAKTNSSWRNKSWNGLYLRSDHYQ